MVESKGMGMGIILTVFISVIVAIVLFQSSAQQAGQTAIRTDVVNATYTIPASNTWIDLKGQELLNVPTVSNQSAVLLTTNYTIEEGVSATTGVKTIRYKNLDNSRVGKLVNVTYTYGADGYIEDTGTIAIVGLIVIFAALAIAVIAMTPVLRSGVLEMIDKI